MRNIAFIDICGTLYDSNTTLDFLAQRDPAFDRYKKRPFVRLVNKIFRVFWKRDFVRTKGIASLKGVQRGALDQEANEFIDTHLSPRKRKQVHDIVERMKSDGFEIILISATMDFIANAIGASIHADKVYATELEYKNTICNGVIQRDLLGKKHLVAAAIAGNAEKIVVITDDKTDLELAKMAGEVYVVAPASDAGFWQKNLQSKMTLIEK